MSPAITLRDVRHAFGSRVVIARADAEFRTGALAVIFGRNGSGKSTLIKLIAGVLRLQEGGISFGGDGATPAGYPRPAYMGQQTRGLFPYTVRDFVLTGRIGPSTYAPGRGDWEHVDYALETTDMVEFGNRLVTELSGGEFQMVRLARLLARGSRVLLLDEPVTHLDLAHQIRTLDLLSSLAASGVTVLVVLHDPTLGLLYGDDVYYMLDGILHHAESVGEFANEALLKRIYSCDLQVLPYGPVSVFVPPLPERIGRDASKREESGG